MMIERRQHKRFKSPQPFEVINKNTDQQLGTLVDLSAGGLLLNTNSILLVNDIYTLRLIVEEPDEEPINIELSAEVVWSHLFEEENINCAGFLITEITEDDLENIEQLLDSWELIDDYE